MMKKRLFCALLAGLTVFSLAGCGNGRESSTPAADNGSAVSEAADADGAESEEAADTAIDFDSDPYEVHFMYLVAKEGSNQSTIQEQINALGDQIGAVNGVSSVVFISREEALQQYDTMLSSYTDLYAALAEDNPLPQMFCVSVNDVAQMQRIVDEISTFEFVDGVDAAIDTANTFLSLQRIVNYICIGLVGVLALVSIVVISNTIRITVFARRKEIAIMKLVGATNGFIRFPFFVEGTTSGLLAAAISSGIVCGAYYALYRWYLEDPTNLTQMFGGTLVPLQQVWYFVVIGFVAFGFVLCGIGTATSIRKHLNV